MSDLKMVLGKLKKIEADLAVVKGCMLDVDTVLSEDGIASVREGLDDLEKGRVVKLDSV